MLLYILLPVAALAMFPLCRDKKSKICCCAAAFAILLAVAALRYNTGYDYNAYASIYTALPRMSKNSFAELGIESGFILPASWLAAFFPDYKVMFLVVAAIISAALGVYIYKYSSNPAVSVFMLLVSGLYFNSLNFLRQFLAALVVLYALRYIGEKRLLRFAAYVLFACTIHNSALIMLLFYFILKIKLTKVVMILYTVAAALTYIFSDKLMSLVASVFYTEYADNPQLANGLPLTCSIGFGVVFALTYLIRDMLLLRSKNNSVLINCMFFAFFFELIGSRHAVISRFSIYFLLPAVLLLLPEIFEILKRLTELTFRKRRQYNAAAATAIIIVLVLCGLFYGRLLANNYNGVLPYTTIFEEGENAAQT